ncbi:NAD(+) diphosphatase [Cellulosilyticum ruminicola]|uniref:NAD(+) diphosphatase n=1 Tax=Cellulosilyticum ruminicola TaxID=425254 RepID=UPI0006D1AA83|nr:NAD(+) diphosphatase [Cellulosilyticum ruminicola]
MNEGYRDYINFWPEFKSEVTKEELKEAIYFIYSDRKVLIKNNEDKLQMPIYETVEKLNINLAESYYLGELKGQICICINVKDLRGFESEYRLIPLKSQLWELNQEIYFVAIKAMQLLEWDNNTKYCGRCGNLYTRKEDERAKVCKKCGRIEYPRISPAIIVGVTKGEEILLAHNANFAEGLYSIIAGFVEQGETLEAAVKREVYEEVGVKVKNIQYVSSKPWSTGDSLMLGFTAEYESGEITVDEKEILDAGWYNKEKLPPVLPLPITTAREIINRLIGIDNTIAGSRK